MYDWVRPGKVTLGSVLLSPAKSRLLLVLLSSTVDTPDWEWDAMSAGLAMVAGAEVNADKSCHRGLLSVLPLCLGATCGAFVSTFEVSDTVTALVVGRRVVVKAGEGFEGKR